MPSVCPGVGSEAGCARSGRGDEIHGAAFGVLLAEFANAWPSQLETSFPEPAAGPGDPKGLFHPLRFSSFPSSAIPPPHVSRFSQAPRSRSPAAGTTQPLAHSSLPRWDGEESGRKAKGVGGDKGGLISKAKAARASEANPRNSFAASRRRAGGRPSPGKRQRCFHPKSKTQPLHREEN